METNLEESKRVLSGIQFMDIIQGKLFNTPGYEQFLDSSSGNPIIQVKNCIVDDDINIVQNHNYQYEIRLKCDFHGALNFAGALFMQPISILGGNFHETVNINRGTFREGFYIGSGVFEKGMAIRSGEFLKSFMISGGEFHNCSITGGQFVNDFFINGGSFKSFSIENGIFKTQFIIAGLDDPFCRFIINGGQFENGLTILNTTITDTFFVFRGAFDGIISLKNSRLSFLDIQQPEISQISIDHSTIGTLLFRNNRYLLTADFDHSIFEALIFEHCTFTEGTVFHISDCKIRDLIYMKSINLGYVNFNSLVGFGNSGGKIELVHSDMGETLFVNCRLDMFQKIIYSGSKLKDMFISETVIPDELNGYRLVRKSIEEMADWDTRNPESEFYWDRQYHYIFDYQQQRYGFTQLKKLYANQGDDIHSLEMYSREMNAYMKELWQGEKTISKLFEEVRLGLNRMSNRHGSRWIRAFFFTLLIGFGFFWIYLYFLGFRLQCSRGSLDQAEFLNSYIFKFLSLIPSKDSLAADLGVKETIASRIVYGFSRIAIIYALYQFIQAFRKHNKISV